LVPNCWAGTSTGWGQYYNRSREHGSGSGCGGMPDGRLLPWRNLRKQLILFAHNRVRRWGSDNSRKPSFAATADSRSGGCASRRTKKWPTNIAGLRPAAAGRRRLISVLCPLHLDVGRSALSVGRLLEDSSVRPPSYLSSTTLIWSTTVRSPSCTKRR
jgi:hypothetical protein